MVIGLIIAVGLTILCGAAMAIDLYSLNRQVKSNQNWINKNGV